LFIEHFHNSALRKIELASHTSHVAQATKYVDDLIGPKTVALSFQGGRLGNVASLEL
jgi:hypothetical protein